MIVTRLRQISLLLIAMAISALAFIQMFQRTAGEFPMQYAGMLALAVVLFLVLWGLIVRFQPYASQSILPCVLLLTATGVTMIARINQSEGWAVAQRQLIWLCCFNGRIIGIPPATAASNKKSQLSSAAHSNNSCP